VSRSTSLTPRLNKTTHRSSIMRFRSNAKTAKRLVTQPLPSAATSTVSQADVAMTRNAPRLLLVIVGLVVAISCSVSRSAKCAPHALLDQDGTIIGGELRASDRELTCGL